MVYTIRETGLNKTFKGSLEELKEYFLLSYNFENTKPILKTNTIDEFISSINSAWIKTSNYDYITKMNQFEVAKRISKNNIIVGEVIPSLKEKSIKKQEGEVVKMQRELDLKKISPIFGSDVISVQIGAFTTFGESTFFTPVHTVDPEMVIAEDILEFCKTGGFSVMITTMNISSQTTEGYWDGYGGYESTETEIFKTVEISYIHFD